MTDPINGAVPEFRPAPDVLRHAEAEASAIKRTGRVAEERLCASSSHPLLRSVSLERCVRLSVHPWPYVA